MIQQSLFKILKISFINFQVLDLNLKVPRRKLFEFDFLHSRRSYESDDTKSFLLFKSEHENVESEGKTFVIGSLHTCVSRCH